LVFIAIPIPVNIVFLMKSSIAALLFEMGYG
jgi:hypothetical protein